MVSDLTVGDGEDVHLFVGDRPTGGCDAVEQPGVFPRHDGGGHHCVALREGPLQLEPQVRECIAQPSAGREKSCRPVLSAFDVFGIVLGFTIDEVGATICSASSGSPVSISRNDARAIAFVSVMAKG